MGFEIWKLYLHCFFSHLKQQPIMKMLKITVLVLFALNLAAPTFQSCSKDFSKADTSTLQSTLENLVKAYNQNVMLEHDKAIFMEGDMTIVTLPSKEVLFFLKKEGAATNDLFIGQGTALSSMLQKDLGKVKVAYLKEAIAIKAADGTVYTFTIGVRKGHELVQKLSPNWSGTGFGLANYYGRHISPDECKGASSTDDLVLR